MSDNYICNSTANKKNSNKNISANTNATKRILTGIKPTGIPHLGNYVGAIRPAIEAIQNSEHEAFFFLADYHGIIGCYDPAVIHESTKAIAATWIACGLDPERVTFYRQSDVPEILELAWILNCSCAKGLMNRAHAYKASVDINMDKNDIDPDQGITMGLFGYPVLMAADILMFNATHVPVGRDQIQHIEMARDIAGTFNHKYKPLFTMPSAVVDNDTPLLTGLDGRKMSKSYGNTIPLFGMLCTQFFPMDGMYRPQNNPLLDWIVYNGRSSILSKQISSRDMRSLVGSIKDGHVIWYSPDQDYGLKQGVMAPFFGVPAATITATRRLAELGNKEHPPAVMALHTYRQTPDNMPSGKRPHYHVTITPALDNYPSTDEMADATRVNEVLEGLIRIDPTQWMWFHRRFKNGPDGRTDIYK